MLIGAGSAGQMILRDIRNSREITDKVMCIIDDNEDKWGRDIDGVPIVGGRDEILHAVEEGDVLAIDAIGKIGDTLGRGISGVLNVFNPGLVVIGGRLIVGKDYLLLPIKTAVNRLSLSRVSQDTTIVLSQLGRKAASVGDCLLSRSKVLGLM